MKQRRNVTVHVWNTITKNTFSTLKHEISFKKYCHLSGVCVTNKTGFGLGEWIYWTFIQVVTTAHKSHTVIFFRLDTPRELFCLPTELLHYSVVLPQFWSPTLFCTTYEYIVPRRTHRKRRFCCQERVFIGPLPSNGCILLSRIVICITQQRAVYQESVSTGTCLPSRCLVVGRYVTIFKNSVSTSQERGCVSVTKVNWLIRFRKIIAVYSVNHMTDTDTLRRKSLSFFAFFLILKNKRDSWYHLADCLCIRLFTLHNFC
jgi:hypothetical protein